MLNIPTKYIKPETGWGLLAVTVALSGAAIIPPVESPHRILCTSY